MSDSNDRFDLKAFEQLTRDAFGKQEVQKNTSSAQVAGFVSRKPARQNSGGLKPNDSRSFRLVIRFSKKERDFIVRHAEEARMTISQYIRLTLLGSPGLDPQRNKQLMKANYELTQQGINLNQITKQINNGTITPGETARLLAPVTRCMTLAFDDLRKAIAGDRTQPD